MLDSGQGHPVHLPTPKPLVQLSGLVRSFSITAAAAASTGQLCNVMFRCDCYSMSSLERRAIDSARKVMCRHLWLGRTDVGCQVEQAPWLANQIVSRGAGVAGTRVIGPGLHTPT